MIKILGKCLLIDKVSIMSRNEDVDRKAIGRAYNDNDTNEVNGIVLKDKTRHITNDSVGTEAFQTLQQENQDDINNKEYDKGQNLNDLTNIPA